MYTVAVSAYRRPEELTAVLHSIPAKRVERVLISIDKPRNNGGDLQKVDQVIGVAENYAKESDHHRGVVVRISDMPLGPAVHVLSTISWLMSVSHEGVFLEDDCLCDSNFFVFLDQALVELRKSPNIWLACGSQYLELHATSQEIISSPYPLVWGIATTRERWNQILESMHQNLLQARDDHFLTEIGWSPRKSYWESGLRHVAEGRLNTWDMPIVAGMQRLGKRALLPNVNLISNIGDGEGSANIEKGNYWVRRSRYMWDSNLDSKVRNMTDQEQKWLEKRLFRIRLTSAIRARVSALRFGQFKSRRAISPILKEWGVVSAANGPMTGFTLLANSSDV